MMRTEFTTLCREVKGQRISIADSRILNFGIQRKEFQKEQLKRLIAAGKMVRGSKTVEERVKRLERKLALAEKALDRLTKLDSELRASALTVVSLANFRGNNAIGIRAQRPA